MKNGAKTSVAFIILESVYFIFISASSSSEGHVLCV